MPSGILNCIYWQCALISDSDTGDEIDEDNDHNEDIPQHEEAEEQHNDRQDFAEAEVHEEQDEVQDDNQNDEMQEGEIIPSLLLQFEVSWKQKGHLALEGSLQAWHVQSD